MSLLSILRPRSGSTFTKKRKGRGHATGQGGTAGKGHKGQKARAGGTVRWGFEGGQTPLMRRLPKFGFNNKVFRTEYDVFNLSALDKLAQKNEINPVILRAQTNLKTDKIKILATGKLTKALTVKAHRFSAAARAAIEAAGGKAEVIE
jgi:large subunit ribosomal protein L15